MMPRAYSNFNVTGKGPSVTKYVERGTGKLVGSKIDVPFDNKLGKLMQSPEEYADYEYFHEYLHHLFAELGLRFGGKEEEELAAEYCMASIAEYRPGFLLRAENKTKTCVDPEHMTSSEIEEYYNAKHDEKIEEIAKKTKPI
jgi:hypothetical protein